MFSLQLHINVLSLLVTLVLSQAFNVQLIIWSDTQGNPHADLWSSLSMHLSVQSFWCSIKILASLKKKKNSSQFCLPELWSLCPQLIKTTVLGLDSSSFCQCLVNTSLREAGIIIGFNSFVFFY